MTCTGPLVPLLLVLLLAVPATVGAEAASPDDPPCTEGSCTCSACDP